MLRIRFWENHVYSLSPPLSFISDLRDRFTRALGFSALYVGRRTVYSLYYHSYDYVCGREYAISTLYVWDTLSTSALSYM